MLGKPCVAGTRITVELIIEKLAAGESQEQLLESHPRLTKESIDAAIDYQEQAEWVAARTQTLNRWCEENPY